MSPPRTHDGAARSGGQRRRPKVVLIFGESQYDTKAIGELFRALRPDFPGSVKPLKEPPVLIRGARPENVPSRARIIANIIRAERVTSDVVCALAHEDCDAIEPAHEQASVKIETALLAEGCVVHAVTPAWELEAWLLLWPGACTSYKPGWRSPDKYAGRKVGFIENVKEELIRLLRPVDPAARARVRDYRESDAPGIAAQARALNLVTAPRSTSNSFERFRDAILTCPLDN